MEELRVVLHALDFKFDIIAISESKLKGKPQIDINLPGYHTPHCKFTEAEKGGTILYISKELNFKPRKDLEIYESKVLESSFVEIINKKELNNLRFIRSLGSSIVVLMAFNVRFHLRLNLVLKC